MRSKLLNKMLLTVPKLYNTTEVKRTSISSWNKFQGSKYNMNTSPAILTHLCFHVTLTIMLTVYCEQQLKLSTIENKQTKKIDLVLSEFFLASILCRLKKRERETLFYCRSVMINLFLW